MDPLKARKCKFTASFAKRNIISTSTTKFFFCEERIPEHTFGGRSPPNVCVVKRKGSTPLKCTGECVATKLNPEISLFFGTSVAKFTLLRERDPSQGVKSGIPSLKV